MARREIADRRLIRCAHPAGCLRQSISASLRFIHLHVAAAEHALLDLPIDGLEPLRGQADPFGQRLPRQPDLMARPVDRLLPVEWKVIAILTHDDLREQRRGDEAAFQERVGERRDDGHGIEDPTLHILRTHRPPAQEARGLVIEPLADFLTNAPPVLRRQLDRLRHDDFLDHRQMLRQARPAFTRRRLARRAPWRLRGHGLRGFSRLVHSLQE